MLSSLYTNSFDSAIQQDAPLIKNSPFLSEIELVKKFNSINNINFNKHSGYVLELDANNGIADIVLYQQRRDWVKYSDIASVKPQWLYALVNLPYRKTINEYTFSDILCTSIKTSKDVLNEFVTLGFCKKTKNGWVKIKQPRAPINKICAIEAKLKNWKRALYQATRYLEFAHQSWVLLDNYNSKPALKNIDEFNKRNIGLITLDVNGNLSILNEVNSKTPTCQYRFWFANNKILNSHST